MNHLIADTRCSRNQTLGINTWKDAMGENVTKQVFCYIFPPAVHGIKFFTLDPRINFFKILKTSETFKMNNNKFSLLEKKSVA